MTSIVGGTVAKRGRYASAWLPEARLVDRSMLYAHRARRHLTVALDRSRSLTGEPLDVATHLGEVAVLRVMAATGTRRTFICGAGSYTTIHCLRPDEEAALTALADLDAGDVTSAQALAERWGTEARHLVSARPPTARRWINQRLDDLGTPCRIPTG